MLLDAACTGECGATDRVDFASEADARHKRAASNRSPIRPVLASRYAAKRISPGALLVTAGLHAAAIAALLTVHHRVEQRDEPELVAIDLTAPPPPPQPESEPRAKAPPVPAFVPKPVLMLPAPREVSVTPLAPDPQPVSVVAEEPVVAPAGPPTLAIAPPAVVPAGDLATRMVAGKPPRYPIESRRKKEQGTVVLALVLGLDGGVETIKVSRSSGFGRLDEAALGAVRKWRWEPTVRSGQPVKVSGMVEIPFVLQA